MTNVLVTGAEGFIGKHLMSRLYEEDFDVLGVDLEQGDLTRSSTWEGLSKKFDVVIHLAGKLYVPDSWEDPFEYMRCNLLTTMNALEYCRENSSKIVLFSSYLYGNPSQNPIPEDLQTTATNPYALSKKTCEEVCKFYSDYFNVNVTIFRPFNIYGPGQSSKLLITYILKQIIDNNDFIKVRDLAPKRDYVYVDDVIDIIIKSISYKSSFEIFNIGSGNSYSVMEVINKIQEITRTDVPVQSLGEERRNEIIDTVADISKAREILKWEPQWQFSDGLSETIRFYQDSNNIK